MSQHDHPDGNTVVVHNAAEHRFEIDKNGQLSVLEYFFKKHRIFFQHTEVPSPLRGQGLGTKLAHVAMEYSGTNHDGC
jgi:predicted GNAT family acetyltransferase